MWTTSYMLTELLVILLAFCGHGIAQSDTSVLVMLETIEDTQIVVSTRVPDESSFINLGDSPITTVVDPTLTLLTFQVVDSTGMAPQSSNAAIFTSSTLMASATVLPSQETIISGTISLIPSSLEVTTIDFTSALQSSTTMEIEPSTDISLLSSIAILSSTPVPVPEINSSTLIILENSIESTSTFLSSLIPTTSVSNTVTATPVISISESEVSTTFSSSTLSPIPIPSPQETSTSSIPQVTTSIHIPLPSSVEILSSAPVSVPEINSPTLTIPENSIESTSSSFISSVPTTSVSNTVTATSVISISVSELSTAFASSFVTTLSPTSISSPTETSTSSIPQVTSIDVALPSSVGILSSTSVPKINSSTLIIPENSMEPISLSFISSIPTTSVSNTVTATPVISISVSEMSTTFASSFVTTLSPTSISSPAETSTSSIPQVTSIDVALLSSVGILSSTSVPEINSPTLTIPENSIESTSSSFISTTSVSSTVTTTPVISISVSEVSTTFASSFVTTLSPTSISSPAETSTSSIPQVTTSIDIPLPSSVEILSSTPVSVPEINSSTLVILEISSSIVSTSTSLSSSLPTTSVSATVMATPVISISESDVSMIFMTSVATTLNTTFISSSPSTSIMSTSSSVPQVTATPLPPNDTALPFISLSSQKQQLRRDLDGVSDAIYIPIGFPFGLQTHTVAFVGTNGVISFSRPFYYWYPSPFPGHFYLRRFYVVAPYWTDHDIRTDGSIFYETFERGRSQNDDSELDRVNKFLQINQKSNFSGTFMIVAEWQGVHPYPHGSNNLNYFELNYPSLADFINQENTYQAIVITDGRESYTVFTYMCDLIQWNGLWSYPTIGYNAAGALFANHPLTGREQANEIDCANGNNQYVNVAYKISADLGVIEQLRSQCLSWYYSDIESYGSSEEVLTFSRNQIACPCTSRQAWWDRRFWYFTRKDDSFCFIERFPNANGGAQECCYSTSTQMFGALVLQGRSSGGLLRYHPWWSYTVNYPNYLEYDRNPQELCCLSAVGYCNFYHERRPPHNCEGYIPQRRTRGWGDPHITTTDGRRYTFNGLGEYVLLRTNVSDFALQGRTMLADGSNATIFTGFAVTNNADVIEVHFINKSYPLLVSLNGTDRSDNLGSVGDNVTTTASSFIERSGNNSITISFPSGVGITINYTAGLLVYTLEIPLSFEGTTSGLLGNYNNDDSDEFVLRNGTMISNSSSDREIHQFGQSWQVTQNESIFTYKQPQSVSDPNHTPPFLDEILSNLMGNSTLMGVCGSNAECLFDFGQTGNAEVGMAAMTVENEAAIEAQEAFSFPPNITAPEMFIATVGEESIYTFTVSSDSQNIIVIILHEGEETLPSGVQLNNPDGDSYTITWSPADNTSVLNLTIVAMDPNNDNISSFFDPVVQLCACENGGNCTTNGLLANDLSFIILNCECPPGYDGQFCQSDADGCDIISCLEGQQCFDYPAPSVGAECACPDGYATDGDSKCVDINECVNGSTNDCTQQCINTPGSFECDCYDGYRSITPNATQCEDINECEEYNDCHQDCTNTDGSFYCSCFTGFILTADNRTCRASVNCSDNNCTQGCALISGMDTCFCLPGYQLDADNTTCMDIDECTQTPCEQNCTNTIGSFNCSCNNGYVLDEDGRSCNDIDECLSGPCPSDLICNNLDGNFSCDCPDGTISNGTDCILETIVMSRIIITPSFAVVSTTSLSVTPSVNTTIGGRNTDDELSTGAVVGIVLGVLIGAFLIIIVAFIIMWRMNKRRGSFSIKPLNSNTGNGAFIKRNPTIPMEVISVGAESNS